MARFDRKRDQRRSPRREFSGNRSEGRDRRRSPEMTQVKCDSCGEQCEVPFKPTTKKPVYCKSCFSKDKSPTGNKELELINEKLDKIMEALHIN